jgi:hypothetical protein
MSTQRVEEKPQVSPATSLFRALPRRAQVRPELQTAKNQKQNPRRRKGRDRSSE